MTFEEAEVFMHDGNVAHRTSDKYYWESGLAIVNNEFWWVEPIWEGFKQKYPAHVDDKMKTDTDWEIVRMPRKNV
jgi:hypothetical protein